MHPAARFASRRTSPSRQHGLTLIELLVTIAVIAIMATVGLPNFQQFTARNEVAAEVMRIRTALALARNTAVTRRTTISVCSSPGPDHDSCTFDDWSNPWVIVEGEASGGDLTGDSLLRVLDDPTRTVSFNRDDRPVRFSPLGRSSGYNGTFSICHVYNETAAVILSNMGRVRTEAESTDC
ncbi:type IV fimbrial biogenesis protein FimT [Halomonas fontilapidosi]|uniref:Type II secretion system protein H n=1 Tax=Halomonas fontilapidosi TaxID=616675 RepID=A0A7W5DMV2_9GAMM|nr:GspH/FimT family pseudopilin [Halomonas fontilapidosi]MBB3185468.1 type IV fimbrial biogenesis protein FimT [Halomonas fontilapidosi]